MHGYVLLYRKEVQAYLELAKDITQQVLNNSIKRKLMRTTQYFADGEKEQEANLEGEKSSAASSSDSATSKSPKCM